VQKKGVEKHSRCGQQTTASQKSKRSKTGEENHSGCRQQTTALHNSRRLKTDGKHTGREKQKMLDSIVVAKQKVQKQVGSDQKKLALA